MVTSPFKREDIALPLEERGTRSRWSAPVIAASIAFLAALFVALLQGVKPFYYDSGGYWSLGGSFVRHGHFSLLNFSNYLRGYLLPLINRGLRALAVAFGWRNSTSVKLFNALLFALIGAVLVPRFAEVAWPKQRWTVRRRLALTTVLIIFWSGYLNFPLSDFPALAMVLVAILAASHPYSARSMLVAGAATAAAIDMRPAYELLAPVVLVLVVWGCVQRRDRESHAMLRRALYLGLLLASFVAISLPQSLSAHRFHDTWSFIPGAAGHLENMQLTDGLILQLYGTYVGPGQTPAMLYKDKAGIRLLRAEKEIPGYSAGKELTIGGAKEYLELMINHPLGIGGVFARHLINGLDERYSTPYAEHLRTDWWLRLGGFLLVFLGLLRILWPKARRSLGPARWRYPVAIVICSATSLPAAVETRYLLPIFILSYVLVLAPSWPNPIAKDALGVRRYRTVATITVAYIAFMAVVWHVTSGASSHLRLG